MEMTLDSVGGGVLKDPEDITDGRCNCWARGRWNDPSRFKEEGERRVLASQSMQIRRAGPREASATHALLSRTRGKEQAHEEQRVGREPDREALNFFCLLLSDQAVSTEQGHEPWN